LTDSRRTGIAASLALLAAFGCSDTDMPATATVQFKVQSPFCGPHAYPLQYSIDEVIVGADTLSDGQLSPRFVTSPGSHRLVAAMTGGIFPNFKMDTTVTLAANASLTQIIDIYCS
jgi:hypothetical protein